jgi:hypothetical protein
LICKNKNGLPSASAMVDAGTSVIVKVVSHPAVGSTLIVSYEKNFRYEGDVVIACLLAVEISTTRPPSHPPAIIHSPHMLTSPTNPCESVMELLNHLQSAAPQL